MQYKWEPMVSLKSLGKCTDEGKAELYEAWEQMRDLTVSSPSIAGSGMQKPGGFWFKLSQMLSGTGFLPALGNHSIQIPGTSYADPISGGTGLAPGGQAPFGLGPFSQFSGFPTGGAAGLDTSSIFASMGIGNAGLGVLGIGDPAYPMAFGTIGGAAAPMGTGTSLGDPGQAPSSLVGASGFGRNKILPAMGILSGIGSIMTNVAPLMGTFGMAGLATGAVLQGLTAPVLAKYEKASNRLVVSADMVLGTKIRNIETVVKQMEAQEDIIKKLLKEQNETNSKALQDLGG